MPPLSDLPPQAVDTGLRRFVNRHETVSQPLGAVLQLRNPAGGSQLERYNRSTGALQRMLEVALRDRVRLRALGGSWSMSAVAATDGWLADTRDLTLFFRILPTMVHPSFTGHRDGLYLAQCGNGMADLNSKLAAEGRSLPTSGASNGQTIAGAIGTGTHGSAVDVGAVDRCVVGLHLIVSPERHVWLERASRPAAADAFAGRLGAELVRDDALFDAALVGLGAFGLVHGVMIESEPIFLLEVSRRRMPLNDGLRRALRLDFGGVALPGGAERPYHFQVLVNPFDSPARAHVTTMYRRPFGPHPKPADSGGNFGPGDDALDFVGRVTNAFPVFVPQVAALLNLAYPEMDRVRGTLGEIFSTTSTRGRTAAASMGIPLDRVDEAFRLVLDINGRHGPYPALVSFRYVPPTRATLGWTCFGPRTCVLELDGVSSGRTRDFFRRVWRAFRERGIPHTMHWGKEIELDAAGVRAMYGGKVDRWIAARETLLPPDVRRVFSNALLEQTGLAT